MTAAGHRSPVDRVPAPALVLVGIVSVQFGAALAATLVPTLGAAGSVTLRLFFSSVVLGLVAARGARARLRGLPSRAWLTVVAFGVVLGVMNVLFYASIGRLPLGVAVTVEFMGPLLLAAALSRRAMDLVAVAGALLGVVLISEVLTQPLGELDVVGLVFAAGAGACWAAYILLAGRTGAAFAQLDGLAIAMVVALVVVAPFGVSTKEEWSPEVLLKGFGIAMLSSVLPYSLELLALRRLSAQVFGILMSLEPAVGALAGWLLLQQVLHPMQLVGMALVVAASVLVMGASRARPPVLDP